jgi:hypothetical protein
LGFVGNRIKRGGESRFRIDAFVLFELQAFECWLEWAIGSELARFKLASKLVVIAVCSSNDAVS